MYLSRVKIFTFRNFASIDVALTSDVVMIGANRSGKSNFIYAIRLVLDAGLSDAARQLKLTDIWDGCDLSTDPEVRIDIEFRVPLGEEPLRLQSDTGFSLRLAR